MQTVGVKAATTTASDSIDPVYPWEVVEQFPAPGKVLTETLTEYFPAGTLTGRATVSIMLLLQLTIVVVPP
jgi:hypothetical protein